MRTADDGGGLTMGQILAQMPIVDFSQTNDSQIDFLPTIDRWVSGRRRTPPPSLSSKRGTGHWVQATMGGGPFRVSAIPIFDILWKMISKS